MCALSRQSPRGACLVIVSLCMLMCVSRSEAKDPLSVRLNWFTNVEDAGILIQKASGQYAAAEINLTVIPYDKKTNACDFVASGRAHIGIEDTVLFAKCRKQYPQLMAFAAKYQINPVAILVLDPAIRSVKDLRGKIVSTAYGYEVYQEIFRDIMQFSDAELPMRHHGWEGEGRAALISGKIDAMFGFEPNDGVALRMAGYHPRVFRSYEFDYDFYGQVYFANRTFVREQMDRIVTFLRITERGWLKAFAHPQQAADIVINQYYPFDPKHSTMKSAKEHRLYQTKELMLFKPYMQRGVGKRMLYMVDAVWKRNIRTLQKMGVIDKDGRADDYYTLAVVRKVYAQ